MIDRLAAAQLEIFEGDIFKIFVWKKLRGGGLVWGFFVKNPSKLKKFFR